MTRVTRVLMICTWQRRGCAPGTRLALLLNLTLDLPDVLSSHSNLLVILDLLDLYRFASIDCDGGASYSLVGDVAGWQRLL